MGSDFSRLMAHLSDNLEAHADRDGLSPVRRAVFLSRGGHAPGEMCPSIRPEPGDRKAWCFTCERLHWPMEWGEGCTDEQTEPEPEDGGGRLPLLAVVAIAAFLGVLVGAAIAIVALGGQVGPG